MRIVSLTFLYLIGECVIDLIEKERLKVFEKD
jgi:hypothetical protein